MEIIECSIGKRGNGRVAFEIKDDTVYVRPQGLEIEKALDLIIAREADFSLTTTAFVEVVTCQRSYRLGFDEPATSRFWARRLELIDSPPTVVGTLMSWFIQALTADKSAQQVAEISRW